VPAPPPRSSGCTAACTRCALSRPYKTQTCEEKRRQCLTIQEIIRNIDRIKGPVQHEQIQGFCIYLILKILNREQTFFKMSHSNSYLTEW
jgi:hypothetical protein